MIDQRTSVARLTSYCERLIQSGRLEAMTELNLRHFVNDTCAAFDMCPVQQDNVSLDQLDRQLLAAVSIGLNAG